jgi:hypothetical protein
LRISDHELAWLALPLFFSLGSPLVGLLTTLDYGSFSWFLSRGHERKRT